MSVSNEDRARTEATRAANAPTTANGGSAQSTGIQSSSGIESSSGIKSSGGLSRGVEGPDQPGRPPAKQKPAFTFPDPPGPAGAESGADSVATAIARLRRQINNIRIVRGAPADSVDVTESGITIKLKT